MLTPLAIVAATVLSYAVAWAIGMHRLVPILNMLAGYPFMIAALRQGRLPLAVARMLVWALAMGACATLLSYARPGPTETLFVHGATYRNEMFTWILTGVGAESDPSRFVPRQLGQAALLVLLALPTAGLAAMTLGAVLMNYMGHYAGALGAAGAHPVLTMALAWSPWALVRIASFVTLGVVMSTPLAARVGGGSAPIRPAIPLLTWACAGLILDMVMKWLLAPAWQRLLLRLTGW